MGPHPEYTPSYVPYLRLHADAINSAFGRRVVVSILAVAAIVLVLVLILQATLTNCEVETLSKVQLDQIASDYLKAKAGDVEGKFKYRIVQMYVKEEMELGTQAYRVWAYVSKTRMVANVLDVLFFVDGCGRIIWSPRGVTVHE